jgi:hypothetical protein
MPLDSVISIMFEMLDYSQLLALRGTSRDLRAVASQDHAWILKYHEMVDDFELSENELVLPAYPLRERGERLDHYSLLPIDADLTGFVLPTHFKFHPPPLRMENGILEDVIYSAIETVGNRTEIYKARPLPLHCTCCKVECDSYVSFTEHCTTSSHKKRLDPSTRFDPRFINARFNDPRHSVGYDALSVMAKFGAMHRYKNVMEAWFMDSCPEPKSIKASSLCQRGAWKKMRSAAANARENVKLDAALFGLTNKEVRAICRECTPERAVEVWLHVILQSFEEGLQGYALEVVQNGWKSLTQHGSSSHLGFLAGMTGLDY